MVEASGHCHMCVRHSEPTGRVVSPPAGAGQIDFGPGVHVRIWMPRSRAFISADEPRGDTHHTAYVAK